MTKAEWSGWVQAVGSVAAIIVGVLIVWYQLLFQRKEAAVRAAESERARISSGLQMLLGRTTQTSLVLMMINEWLDNEPVPWESLSSTASHLSSHLDQIQTAEFPYPPAAAMITGLRAPLVRIAQLLEECVRADSLPGQEVTVDMVDKLKYLTNDLKDAANRSHQWLANEAYALMTEKEAASMKAALSALKSKPEEKT